MGLYGRPVDVYVCVLWKSRLAADQNLIDVD